MFSKLVHRGYLGNGVKCLIGHNLDINRLTDSSVFLKNCVNRNSLTALLEIVISTRTYFFKHKKLSKI